MDQELTCNICNDLPVDSTALECAHVFCLECIDHFIRSKRNSLDELKCPVCRYPINLDNTIENEQQQQQQQEQGLLEELKEEEKDNRSILCKKIKDVRGCFKTYFPV